MKLDAKTTPLFGLIYNLLELELKKLKSYLKEKPALGLIKPNKLPVKALIPLLKAKMNFENFVSIIIV